MFLLYYYVKRLIVWTGRPANRKKLGYLERIILFTVVRQSPMAGQSNYKRHTSITEVKFYHSNCILVPKATTVVIVSIPQCFIASQVLLPTSRSSLSFRAASRRLNIPHNQLHPSK